MCSRCFAEVTLEGALPPLIKLPWSHKHRARAGAEQGGSLGSMSQSPQTASHGTVSPSNYHRQGAVCVSWGMNNNLADPAETLAELSAPQSYY